MKIKKIAIGNEKGAFIENRLSDKVNVIYSDDNNKGKTIVLQGLMYAMGNEPIFPKNFNYKDYYFYVQAEINEANIEFLRKKDNIIVRQNDEFYEFSSVSELKYFYNDKIIHLPRIYKDNREKIVDLSLLYEMFFIGQDKRDPSSLFSSYYKKDDFINMLCSLSGYPITNNNEDIQSKKEKIKLLKSEIVETKKQLSLMKSNSKLSEWVNKYEDAEAFEQMKSALNKINDDISYYRRKRKYELNRKIKLEQLLQELNSLNREIEKGKVICSECGSDKILYVNKDLRFDVSNFATRSKVMQSIKYHIEQKMDMIDEYSRNINLLQDKLKLQLEETPEDIRNILLFTNEIMSEKELDTKLSALADKLNEAENAKEIIISSDEASKENKNNLLKNIIEKMNILYREVDKQGNLVFDTLFTKKTSTFSGSEEQEYYYCRLLAINECLMHEFPIIVDCYRDGELSTDKESIMLKNYKSISNQVILTSTLKNEEYSNQKYGLIDDINAIDYSANEDSKILVHKYVEPFRKILASFNICVDYS